MPPQQGLRERTVGSGGHRPNCNAALYILNTTCAVSAEMYRSTQEHYDNLMRVV